MAARPGRETGRRDDRERQDQAGGRRPSGAGRTSGPTDRGGRAGAGRGGERPRLDDSRRAELEQRTYDPRREERRKATRVGVPDDVDARMLDPEARRELRSLTRETADLVARHLVVTGRTLDDDPTEALTHARAARAMAGRIGVVREAAGLAAYAAGEWNEALAELRAARRITGRPEHLAVMADCERALGRPERALAYADDSAVAGLPPDERVELVIVLAGARRDMGQADAAVLTLQDPARRTTGGRPWAARLWYAYADALLHAGRVEQARAQFEKVVQVDVDGQTDAGDRLLQLDGIVVEDLGDDEDDSPELSEDELAAYVAEAFPPPASVRENAGAGAGDEDAADRGGPLPGAAVPQQVAADVVAADVAAADVVAADVADAADVVAADVADAADADRAEPHDAEADVAVSDVGDARAAPGGGPTAASARTVTGAPSLMPLFAGPPAPDEDLDAAD